MYPATLMPGASRLRAIHPLLEEDGVCTLIYDLERAAVFEVPSELQLYIGAILERGDLDEAVLSWLVREDLLTSESQGGWSERSSAAEDLLGLEDPGWTGTALHLQDEFQARIENSDRRELGMDRRRREQAGEDRQSPCAMPHIASERSHPPCTRCRPRDSQLRNLPRALPLAPRSWPRPRGA